VRTAHVPVCTVRGIAQKSALLSRRSRRRNFQTIGRFRQICPRKPPLLRGFLFLAAALAIAALFLPARRSRTLSTLAPSPSKMPCSRFARDARNTPGFARSTQPEEPRTRGVFLCHMLAPSLQKVPCSRGARAHGCAGPALRSSGYAGSANRPPTASLSYDRKFRLTYLKAPLTRGFFMAI